MCSYCGRWLYGPGCSINQPHCAVVESATRIFPAYDLIILIYLLGASAPLFQSWVCVKLKNSNSLVGVRIDLA